MRALHQRLGAAAGRDLRGLARAHRPHHPRALRHERDRDADLQPVRSRADGERRGGTVGFPLPGRRAARARRRTAQPLPAGRDRRHRGARPERLRRLLAHAREDAGGVHRRRLVSHRRRRQGRRPRLRHHRRPQQGPDHQRRLQRLSRRGRGLPSTSCPASPRAPWSACRMPTSARRWSPSSCAQARRRRSTAMRSSRR